MITTSTGAKKLESSDNWREIFPNPGTSAAGAHNATVDAQDRIQAEVAPIINGKRCSVGAASGDYVLLRNSTIAGKTDGAYKATKAIPANTDLDSTYLGSPITGGMVNELNSNMTTALSRISALENLPTKIVGEVAWYDYHDCNDCLNPNYGYQIESGSLHSPGDYYTMWVSKTSWGLIQFANHYYDGTFKIRAYSRDNNHWSDWQTLTSGHKKMKISQLTGTTGTGGAVGNMEFSLSSYPGLTAIIPIKTIVNNWMLTWEGLFGGTYHVISARNFTTGAWASGETITFTALLIYD